MLWNKYTLINHLFHTCLVVIAHFSLSESGEIDSGSSFFIFSFSIFLSLSFTSYILFSVSYLCLKKGFYLLILCSCQFSSISCPSFFYVAGYLVCSRYSKNILRIRDYWFNEEIFRDQNGRVGKWILHVCS